MSGQIQNICADVLQIVDNMNLRKHWHPARTALNKHSQTGFGDRMKKMSRWHTKQIDCHVWKTHFLSFNLIAVFLQLHNCNGWLGDLRDCLFVNGKYIPIKVTVIIQSSHDCGYLHNPMAKQRKCQQKHEHQPDTNNSGRSCFLRLGRAAFYSNALLCPTAHVGCELSLQSYRLCPQHVPRFVAREKETKGLLVHLAGCLHHLHSWDPCFCRPIVFFKTAPMPVLAAITDPNQGFPFIWHGFSVISFPCPCLICILSSVFLSSSIPSFWFYPLTPLIQHFLTPLPSPLTPSCSRTLTLSLLSLSPPPWWTQMFSHLCLAGQADRQTYRQGVVAGSAEKGDQGWERIKTQRTGGDQRKGSERRRTVSCA